jgi:hypothetical protein
MEPERSLSSPPIPVTILGLINSAHAPLHPLFLRPVLYLSVNDEDFKWPLGKKYSGLFGNSWNRYAIRYWVGENCILNFGLKA